MQNSLCSNNTVSRTKSIKQAPNDTINHLVLVLTVCFFECQAPMFRPAMVVELKYNQSADTAIRQIKEKRYQGALADYHDK